MVTPLIVIVHTTRCRPSAYDAGTVMEKTPLSRRGRTGKCVGWLPLNSAGSIKLFGPMGISTICSVFRLK